MKPYETTDFYPACAMIAAGCDYEMEKTSRGDWKWVFRDRDVAQDALHEYEMGKLTVDAQKLVNIIKIMKTKVKD